jgi:small subunit ribosomal protein S17
MTTQNANSNTARTPLKGTKIGRVVSAKCEKTRKVVVAFQAQIPKYGKYVRRRSIFQIHDEKNESNLGDTVEIAPCRPISKTKNWRLVRVVEKAPLEQATHVDEVKVS